jgi:dienelactone hydrolase
MWTYHLRCLDDLQPVPRPEDHIVDGTSLRSWQENFRAALAERLGPRPERVTLDLEREPVSRAGDEGFTRHRVVYASERHLDVPAWLLVPDDATAPAPALLAVHGHGPDGWTYEHGRDTVVGPVPADPEAGAALERQGTTFGADLARAGFVVLAPDLRGFGERWDGWTDDHRLCDLELAQALARGSLPLSGNLWDLHVALDVLQAEPVVDSSRIGVVGFSYGGTLALLLAALDERVGAVVASGAFSDPRVAARVPFNLCGAQVLPGMLADIDHVGLGAAIAPRALFVENGEADLLWPAPAATMAAARLAQVYAAVGASDRFAATTFDGPHRWHGAGVARFLHDHLR